MKATFRYILALLFFVSLSSQWVSALPLEFKKSHCGTGSCCPIKPKPQTAPAYCSYEKPEIKSDCDCNEQDLNQRSRIKNEGANFMWSDLYNVCVYTIPNTHRKVKPLIYIDVLDPPPELA